MDFGIREIHAPRGEVAKKKKEKRGETGNESPIVLWSAPGKRYNYSVKP